MAENIERMEYPGDPDRCQAMTKIGQCTNKCMPGVASCAVHGGNAQLKSQEKKSLDNYRIDLYKSKLIRLKNSPGIKSLRDEIAILRLLLEEEFAEITSPAMLAVHAGNISDLVLKINVVVNSCHKLEANMGEHITKSTLINFAIQVVEIIKQQVAPEIAKEIAASILLLVTEDQSD